MRDIYNVNKDEIKFKQFKSKDNLRISISDSTYEEIYLHANENNDIEICGVLIGDIYKDDFGPYIEISDLIRGEHAESKEGQVMFTFETWAYINEIKEKNFKEYKIIGWYHSHPGFGIFLSQQDKFIYENFFNQDWQVSFVVDPKSNEDGFFVWSNDEPVFKSDFSVTGYSKIISGRYQKPVLKKADKVEKEKIKEIKQVIQTESSPKFLLWFVVLIVLINLALTLNYIYLDKGFFSQKNQVQKETNTTAANISVNTDVLKYQNMIKSKIDSLNLFKYYNFEIGLIQNSGNPNDINTTIIKSTLDSLLMKAGLNFIIVFRENNCIIRGSIIFNKDKDKLVDILKKLDNIGFIDMEGLKVNNTYLTKQNDNLKSISSRFYGKEDLSEKIYDLNKDKIKNKDSLEVNLEIKLPE